MPSYRENRSARAAQPVPNARLRPLQIITWLILLSAPVFALHRLTRVVDAWILGASAAAVIGLTYALYAVDKRRARAGQWRIPESTLHGCALLGGWPGAYLAQRRLRHKISKPGFQTVFWLTVAAHEFVAIDYLRGWPLIHLLRDAISRA